MKIFAKLLMFPLLTLIALLLSLAIIPVHVVNALLALGINLLCIEPLICVLCGIYAARQSVNILIVSIWNAGILPLVYILLFYVLSGEPESLMYGGVWFLWLFCWTIISAIIARQKIKKAQE